MLVRSNPKKKGKRDVSAIRTLDDSSYALVARDIRAYGQIALDIVDIRVAGIKSTSLV